LVPEQSLPGSAVIIDEILDNVVNEDENADVTGVMNRVAQKVGNTSVYDVMRVFEVWSQRLFRALNLIFAS